MSTRRCRAPTKSSRAADRSLATALAPAQIREQNESAAGADIPCERGAAKEAVKALRSPKDSTK